VAYLPVIFQCQYRDGLAAAWRTTARHEDESVTEVDCGVVSGERGPPSTWRSVCW
jgi:hypothetical protein